jgi:hypothetical protein
MLVHKLDMSLASILKTEAFWEDDKKQTLLPTLKELDDMLRDSSHIWTRTRLRWLAQNVRFLNDLLLSDRLLKQLGSDMETVRTNSE